MQRASRSGHASKGAAPAGRQPRPAPHTATLALQRTAGNRAVIGLLRRTLARQALDPDAAPLRSCILSLPELQAAARNSPTLKQGKHGADVASVQYALRKLGYPL